MNKLPRVSPIPAVSIILNNNSLFSIVKTCASRPALNSFSPLYTL